MNLIMRRMACSLVLNVACTAAPCFAHPQAALAETLPAPRHENVSTNAQTEQLIRLHQEQTDALARKARTASQTRYVPPTQPQLADVLPAHYRPR